MHHVVLDRWSRGSSCFHHRDPRAKIVALLALLVALATASRGIVLLGGALAFLLLVSLRWARIPVGAASARAALVLPFTAVFAGLSWMAGDPTRALFLGVKSYVSALAVVWLVSTTPLPMLLRGFGRLGAPRFLLEVGQFLYRYLFVISEEGQHMRNAAAARGGPVRQWINRRNRFRAAAGALAVLFARSYLRAEEIHRAMLARGFQGTLPVLEAGQFRVGDALFAVAAVVLIVTLRIASQGMVE